MYNKNIMEHFLNPSNAGGLRGADAVGKATSENNADIVKFYLKINNETTVIEDAHFKAFGCPVSIACSDVVCELIKGKTIEEADEISNVDIINSVGDLPVDKIACATTVEEAVHDTINVYKNKKTKIKK